MVQNYSPRLIGDVLLLPRRRIIPLVSHVEAFQPVLSLVRVLASFFRRDHVPQYGILTGDVSKTFGNEAQPSIITYTISHQVLDKLVLCVNRDARSFGFRLDRRTSGFVVVWLRCRREGFRREHVDDDLGHDIS